MKINVLDIRKLDLNLAVVFLALWQERSVTHAAARLALSQAAASAALARLRESCGDALFVRTRGAMEPTPRACAMAEQLEAGVMQIWQGLTQHRPFDPAAATRSFSIGMSDDFELALGPLLVRQVSEEAPNVSLIFRQTNRHAVERMLSAREIEFAVVSGMPARAWIAQTALGQAGYACIADVQALDRPWPLSLDDYLSMPHVLVSFSGRSGIVDTALQALGRQRRVQTALTHFSAVPAFLEKRRAVVTLPDHAAVALARVSRLSTCQVPLALGEYPVQLLMRRDSEGDAALAWLREKIRVAADTAMQATQSIAARQPPRTGSAHRTPRAGRP